MNMKNRHVYRDAICDVGYVPASASSSTVKPSLQTFRWVRVTVSDMPWRVNSSLRKNGCGENVSHCVIDKSSHERKEQRNSASRCIRT